MADDWKDTTDPTSKLVIGGLADPQWEWRTVDGLARSASISPDEVRRVLRTHSPMIQRSSTSTADGKDLYTLKSRYYERKGPIKKAWDFLSPSSSSSSS